MAQTRNYLNHLLQSTGITPACSMEERAAADEIAKAFASHGLTPEVQEFSASGSAALVTAVLGLLVFVGTVLAGFGGAIGIVGVLLLIVGAVLFVLERLDRPVLSHMGTGGLSQNVIAHHEATGPMASPRNRPVVVVAHYDSPRADVFAQMPYATYRPLIMRFLPAAMVAPALMMILRLLPVPGTAKLIVWILAILIAAVPLIRAIATILNRLVLPYTSGAVCNKSSVAALLGIMDDVAPYEGKQEFPEDVPFERYIDEQRRAVEQERLAEEPARSGAGAPASLGGAHAAPRHRGPRASADSASSEGPASTSSLPIGGSANVEEDLERESTLTMEPVGAPAPEEPSDLPSARGAATEVADESVSLSEAQNDDESAAPAASSTKSPSDEAPECQSSTDPSVVQTATAPVGAAVDGEGVYRHGAAVIRSLRMVPASCELIYEDGGSTGSSASSAPVRSQDVPDSAPVGDSISIPGADHVEASSTVPDRQEAATDPESSSEGMDEPSTAVEPESRHSYIADDDDFEYEYEDDQDDDPSFSSSRTEHSSGYATLAETLSGVGAGAARILDATIRKGKDLLGGVGASQDAEQETADTVNDSLEPLREPSEALFDESWESSVDDAASAAPEPDPDLGATVAQESLPSAPAPSEQQARIEEQLDSKPERAPMDERPAPDQMRPASDDRVQQHDAAPHRSLETVDSLMDQISRSTARSPRRALRVPEVPLIGEPTRADDPRSTAPDQMLLVPAEPTHASDNRSSLFDLPDPAVSPTDPFSPETVDISPSATSDDFSSPLRQDANEADPYEVISPSDLEPLRERSDESSGSRKKRGFGRLLGRQKEEKGTMTSWLGVDEDFDARAFGRDVGTWDNFETGDEDDWKGGAAGDGQATEEELRAAITSMGDDELLGHDIWFVATGASEMDAAGMKAFLDAHRDKLRGVFLINLECVGAGDLAMVASEGGHRVLKGDKRIMNLVRKVSGAFHHEFATVDMPYISTDAHEAMAMSLRALTIAGVDGPRFALSHSEDDLPCNVDPGNIALAADVVTEVIRRS